MTPPPTPRQAAAEALAVIDRLAHSGRPIGRGGSIEAEAAYRRLAVAMAEIYGPMPAAPRHGEWS